MSNRLDFYEIRKGTPDDWDRFCLVKTEDEAQAMLDLLHQAKGTEFHYEHVEFIATTDLTLESY